MGRKPKPEQTHQSRDQTFATIVGLSESGVRVGIDVKRIAGDNYQLSFEAEYPKSSRAQIKIYIEEIHTKVDDLPQVILTTSKLKATHQFTVNSKTDIMGVNISVRSGREAGPKTPLETVFKTRELYKGLAEDSIDL